jgi:hypothetical protein
MLPTLSLHFSVRKVYKSIFLPTSTPKRMYVYVTVAQFDDVLRYPFALQFVQLNLPRREDR